MTLKSDKEYLQPDYDDMRYKINIKILQTDRKSKNTLMLSRSPIKTLEIQGNHSFFKKESVETVLASAQFTFQILWKSLGLFYNNIDEDKYESTSGIWQVIILRHQIM